MHRTEAGWRLDRRFWGRGLATEGALASLRYGFEERGLERIISMTVPENVASWRVMQKIGLTYRGETRWRGEDVVWYAIDRKMWEAKRADQLDQLCSSANAGRVPSMRKATTSRKSPLSS